MSSPTGQAFGNTHGIVFDSNGVAIPPKQGWSLLDGWERSYRAAWGSLDELNASLASAPEPKGLPEGAPSPNAVYLEGGALIRYVVDPDVKREPFVSRGTGPDGEDEVRERLQFRKQYVALTLEGARLATDKRKEGEPETDFWCGYTWIRGGYSPERTAPVEVQIANLGTGPQLVFDQPASPTEAARIRHEVAAMDRRAPTLPIEPAAAQKRRGRPPKATDDTAGATSPAED